MKKDELTLDELDQVAGGSDLYYQNDDEYRMVGIEVSRWNESGSAIAKVSYYYDNKPIDRDAATKLVYYARQVRLRPDSHPDKTITLAKAFAEVSKTSTEDYIRDIEASNA